MIEFGIGLALLSAASQASVHMIWKAAGDKLVIRAIIGLIEAGVMIPLVLFVQLPSLTLWGWLILSTAIHLIYQLVLIEAYKSLDFSVAYPMARGVAPIATAILGILLLGDELTIWAFLGIVGISAGLLIISFSAKTRLTGLAAAICAGLLTTCYTLVDAQGMRSAANAFTFIVWFFVLDGLAILFVAFIRRGRTLGRLMKAEGHRSLIGGSLSLLGFSAALGSFKLISVGAASALRETSVVFASILARVYLKEKVSICRISGMVCIVGGAILIALNL